MNYEKDVRIDEIDSILHKSAGLLQFLGGAVTKETIKSMRFEEFLRLLIFNGGKILITVDKKYLDTIKQDL